MVELTDREKKIIMIKFIMHGLSPFTTLSIEDRERSLIAALNYLGLRYDREEMLDIGEAILKTQHDFLQGGQDFINSLSPMNIKKTIDYCTHLLESSKLKPEEAKKIQETLDLLKNPSRFKKYIPT